MKAVYDRLIALLERALGSGGILAYHGVGPGGFSPGIHVTPDTLRRQLRALAGRYRVVPLSEIVARLRGGQSIRGHLAVTFDDAYWGVARYAEPILRELGIPATVFVVTGALSQTDPYWWDVVESARVRSPDVAWREVTAALGLNGLAPHDPSANQRVKERVFAKWRGRGAELGRRLGRVMEAEPWRSCRVGELQALARNEQIEFGCHTTSHPVLPLLDREDQVREIQECRSVLADCLPRVLPYLAYPYGQYDEASLAAAREAGIEAAFSVEPRFPVTPGDSLMAIPRLCVMETTTPPLVARNLARAHRPVRIWWKGKDPRLPAR
jgi:peptidoglycan/xylan/chitin deacetylase (PgdA/CDA1 family)